MSLLALHNLRYRLGDQVLPEQPINLTLNAGECLVLFGPSGVGKTSLLRAVAGLLPANQGQIMLNGHLPTRKRQLAMVFQDYSLFPHLTVAQNLSLGLIFAGQKPSEYSDALTKMAERLQLTALLTRLPAQLSGGQKQRVALGRAMLSGAQVLLLDEPFANLDAALRMQMREQLGELLARLAISCILVSHELDDAMALADNMAVLSHQGIEQLGTPQQLYQQPANVAVAQRLSALPLNLWQGDGSRTIRQRLHALGCTSPLGDSLAFRANQPVVTISKALPGHNAVLVATVVRVIGQSDYDLLHIQLDLTLADGTADHLVLYHCVPVGQCHRGQCLALNWHWQHAWWFNTQGQRVNGQV